MAGRMGSQRRRDRGTHGNENAELAERIMLVASFRVFRAFISVFSAVFPQTRKSISRYLGSGHSVSSTVFSSLSHASRTTAIASETG